MSPQAGFILNDQIVPRLYGAVPRSVLCVGSEDPQELIQDSIVMAAKMIDRVEQQGKLGKVSASNIAYYTVQHMKSGRRANGSSTVDIMSTATQLNGLSKLHSLNEVVSESEAGDEIFELNDVISQDSEDPSVQAARNLDWNAFCHSLSKLEMQLINCLVNGMGIREAAELARVNYSTMLNYRNKIAVKIAEFMGADILKTIAELPQWKIGLDCERAMMACRADRRAN
jgi:hypothetical protein